MEPLVLQFERPPVDEVVFSVQFNPLERFLVPHFGLLWERFRTDYPACEDVPPLLSVIEQPEGQTVREPDLDPAALLPRVWFLQPTGPGLVQVQRNRFLVNWRRRGAETEYPGFETLSRRFRQHLGEFETFLGNHDLGSLTAVQYELTYINVISRGEGWDSPNEISRVFPGFSWLAPDAGALRNPQGLDWRVAFPLPEQRGRLHISLQLARRKADGALALRLELTARGMAEDTSREAMKEWFDAAHNLIVQGFQELTSEEVQREIWRRKY